MEITNYYDSPTGVIGITEENGAVTQLFFSKKQTLETSPLHDSALLEKTWHALQEYFSGTRRSFEDIPVNLLGTPFQKNVWKALCDIPYGETRSYKEVAKMAGNVKACRAVGMANNRNPVAILIPCHRVIGADGSLVGYGGGLPVKRFLLDLEAR